ncbi:hypothetical protein FCE95_11010 [Luteimonas gilva]|uniref:Uncharacterized protein n=1 Tax=Luteimonas gilva TaxID=2572684 RepID=A0A4U5JLX6_9GAMM|nr:hypothetical protein [Luteimonas gilva]TKR30632.1 hypothetical protein FCE95_11010 [Luteimonas gilva]
MGAALAVAAIAWISRPQPKALATKIDESWIPMPPDGMDASGFAARRLLFVADSMPEDDALTRTCGSYDSDGASERYRAVIGDPLLKPDARMWRLDLLVQGSQIQVTIEDASFPLRPPPPDARDEAQAPAFAPRRYWLQKAELEPIRAAWAEPALWLAEQRDVDCFDGRPVFLEACVHGRYAARARNCDSAADEAARKLWTLLQKRFP